MNDLQCSPAVEDRPWTLRNLLYGAVQDTVFDQQAGDRAAVKQAYEEITTLLNQLQSNLVRPNSTWTADSTNPRTAATRSGKECDDDQ